MESTADRMTPMLVVDDDVGLLLSIKAAVVSAGLPEPALLSDSRQVMECIGKGDFHLVILDLIMPHIHGMELLSQIKKEYPAIEIIVITAVDDVASAVHALKYDAYDYLVKPVKRGEQFFSMKSPNWN